MPPKAAPKKTGEKGKKGPNPYQLFMKEELARLKKADPKLAHKCAPAPLFTPPPCVGPRAPSGSRCSRRARGMGWRGDGAARVGRMGAGACGVRACCAVLCSAVRRLRCCC